MGHIDVSTLKDPVIEALFSACLVSHLQNEDLDDQEKPMQNLFETYADSFYLVHINSILMGDIINI